MDIRQFDQRIALQQMTVVRDAVGGHAETWATLATVWAKVRDMSGKEIFSAKAAGNAVSQCLTIRYRSDVKAAMRVLFADGSLARIEWIRQMNRKEYLELYAVAING